LTVVDLHFIFRHRIGGEVLHNFLLNQNISNFALSRIVDEIANTKASPEATWSSLLAWAMDAFSWAHKELSEPRRSCSHWWTSLKPLCCGSGCGCSCGCGLLLSQRGEHHGSQMLQTARTENYWTTLSLLISCLNQYGTPGPGNRQVPL
jgi:hypothetical protein